MPQSTNTPTPPVRLLDRLRDTIRRRHLSYATEQAYVAWCKRHILFHEKKHPDTMGEDEIRAFLNYLAVERSVSASTQNQALNAIVFLYSQVLERDLGSFGRIERAKRPERLPVVLSRPRRTRSGTASPRICSKAGRTSARCRSCSVTRTYPRR